MHEVERERQKECMHDQHLSVRKRLGNQTKDYADCQANCIAGISESSHYFRKFLSSSSSTSPGFASCQNSKLSSTQLSFDSAAVTVTRDQCKWGHSEQTTLHLHPLETHKVRNATQSEMHS